MQRVGENMKVQSNITLLSNIYINRSRQKFDKLLMAKIRDYDLLKRLQSEWGTLDGWDFTPLQRAILEQGTPHCGYGRTDVVWGMPIGDARFICRCEQRNCKLYAECIAAVGLLPKDELYDADSVTLNEPKPPARQPELEERSCVEFPATLTATNEPQRQVPQLTATQDTSAICEKPIKKLRKLLKVAEKSGDHRLQKQAVDTCLEFLRERYPILAMRDQVPEVDVLLCLNDYIKLAAAAELSSQGCTYEEYGRPVGQLSPWLGKLISADKKGRIAYRSFAEKCAYFAYPQIQEQWRIIAGRNKKNISLKKLLKKLTKINAATLMLVGRFDPVLLTADRLKKVQTERIALVLAEDGCAGMFDEGLRGQTIAALRNVLKRLSNKTLLLTAPLPFKGERRLESGRMYGVSRRAGKEFCSHLAVREADLLVETDTDALQGLLRLIKVGDVLDVYRRNEAYQLYCMGNCIGRMTEDFTRELTDAVHQVNSDKKVPAELKGLCVSSVFTVVKNGALKLNLTAAGYVRLK